MVSKDIIKYNENIVRDELQLFCNTRAKNYRYKGNRDIFKQTIYNYSQVLKEEHNCVPYFFTVTFPIDKDNRNIEREWRRAGTFLEMFKEKLSEHYLVVGGVIAVEPHKNSSLKSARGKNTKAGSPHYHMVLWLCHQVLNPHLDRMGYALLLAGSFTKISLLSSRMDVLKATVYTVKEMGNEVIERLCTTYTNMKNSVNIWSNHKETNYVFQQIHDSLNAVEQRSHISNEFFNQFPTTRNHKDKALFLSELFAKLFAVHGMTLRHNNIYRRVEGTKFSWYKYIPFEDWIAQKFDFNAPPAYLQMLKDNALWISKQGAVNKNMIEFDIYPRLIISKYLIEFTDYVYEFFDGNIRTLQSVEPNTATLCYVDNTFDQCTPPFTILGLLHSLIAYGEDITQNRKRVFNIPEGQLQNDDIVCIKNYRKHEEAFIIAIKAFGGLYHPEDNRKKNPAIYLQGPPSTYKTFLVHTIFKKLVGLDSVKLLSRHSSRFNTATLRNKDEPYILVIDDMRWDGIGMHLADFINLLDGYFVKTEQKYKSPQSGQLKGTIAITSNVPIGGDIMADDVGKQDRDALGTRLQEVELFKLKEQFVFNPKFLQQLEKEAVGFSILTNAFYLARNGTVKQQSRIPKSFFTNAGDEKQQTQNTTILQKAGIEHMNNILKLLEKDNK